VLIGRGGGAKDIGPKIWCAGRTPWIYYPIYPEDCPPVGQSQQYESVPVFKFSLGGCLWNIYRVLFHGIKNIY